MLGLWTASFHLGNFTGSTVSGFLVQSLGFRGSSVIFLCLYSVMFVIDGVYFLKHFGKVKMKRFEYEDMKNKVATNEDKEEM